LTQEGISFIFEFHNGPHNSSSGVSPPSSSRPHAAPAEVCIAIR
jgi:hypothetical protein